MESPRRIIFLAVIAGAIAAFGIAAGATAYGNGLSMPEVALPPGFDVALVTDGLTLPVDMEFLPSGDILVAEKGTGEGREGRSYLRLIRNGVLQSRAIFQLSTNTANDSGLASIALDPNFAENGYIYMWYATGNDAPGAPSVSVNRLSRITFDPAVGTADPDSYTILLDRVPHADKHNGGGMAFGPDGMLYIAIGDTGREGLVQDLTSLVGKVLRISPTANGYDIPEDNPFVETPGARPEIYAVGLRNPWRMTRTRGGALFVGDVGGRYWEELNRVLPGANYGWSKREGPCAKGLEPPCPSNADIYTMPALYYPHADKVGGALTGMAFYEGDAFPAEFHDKLFFGDYALGRLGIAAVQPDAFSITWLYSGAGAVVDVVYFRNNIYWLDIQEGSVYLLSYEGSDNVTPVAALESDRLAGAAPLPVRFSAEGSYDPDDAALTFILTPGDGSSPIRSSNPVIEYAYSDDGTYTASLQVEDGRGGVSAPVTVQITVYSGAWPKMALTNITQPGRMRFHGGDTFLFEAQRAGDASDLDSEAPYSWRIDLLHNDHAHPELVDKVAMTGTLTIPTANHDGDIDLGYRLSLTMRTATGQPVTVVRELEPAVADVTITSSPNGNSIVRVDNEPSTYPVTFPAIVGTTYMLEAAELLLTHDGVWEFLAWSTPTDGELSTDRQIDVTVPVDGQRIQADYLEIGPANRVYLPEIVKAR